MAQSVETLFGPDSRLAKHISGFAPRQQQRDLALAVEQALAKDHVLVAEAGTGVGKTFAYLVPAVASGKKVIVSTGTKTLQDQLFFKDMPVVVDALADPVDVALLKGRANYLCLYRMEQAARATADLRPFEQATLRKIRAWSKQTNDGDISEFSGLNDSGNLHAQITSTPDNCLGSECQDYEKCFLMKARRKAQEADVVVVNHHLLMADISLKAGGFGELLPTADAIILDEAHQVPEVATQFFGTSVSSGQLLELARDTQIEQLTAAKDYPVLADAARAVEKAVRDTRLVFADRPMRMPWQEVLRQRNQEGTAEAHFSALLDELINLQAELEKMAERSAGLEACHRRAADLEATLRQVLRADPEDGDIRWLETYTRNFHLHLTPLELGERFQQVINANPAAWIFTSATLSVANDFSHFTERLGLDPDETLQLDSPFPYDENAWFFVPKGLPDPREDGYTEAVVEEALPILQASKGRAFMLFTSYRALNIASAALRDRVNFPLFVQGEGARNKLLEDFRKSGDGILLGTSSFWEGVDVRGSALSLVIIDKLPFAAPNDPITQARTAAMRQAGRDPFGEYQLPQAVITLKQGVGRLIRDTSDTGALMICDPRLLRKRYGHTFLDSLPNMARTRDPEDVVTFFAELAEEDE